MTPRAADPRFCTPRWALCTAIIIMGVLSVGPPSLATAQMGELLLYGGDEYEIESLPFEPYLDKHPDARPRTDVINTALRRGYTGTWEITDGRLFLLDIEALRADRDSETFETESFSVMERIFPGRWAVSADWYTGYLVVPFGELVEYVHMGFASVFESYYIIRVEQGVVVQRREMSAEQFRAFRDAQFRAFQQTAEYQRFIERATARGDSLEEAEEFASEVYNEVYLSQVYEQP